MHASNISILLSTYNGEKYLKAQLDSLCLQSYTNFTIIARDDGSTDKTVEILKSYNVKILPFTKNLGAKGSFAELLSYAVTNTDAKYFMFCDQDDIWQLNKIEKTLSKMQEMEEIYLQMPVLVHSDLIVVDQNLQILSPSLWNYQNIDPTKDTLNRLLLHNVVTGCTMMINRSLAIYVNTMPKETIMHDWWMAMVASSFGQITYLDEPLILYRQHDKNDTGAKKYNLYNIMRIFLAKIFSGKYKSQLDKYILQSRAFLSLYKNDLDEQNKKMLEEFSRFNTISKWHKIKTLFKYKIWKNGLLRNLGMVLFV